MGLYDRDWVREEWDKKNKKYGGDFSHNSKPKYAAGGYYDNLNERRPRKKGGASPIIKVIGVIIVFFLVYRLASIVMSGNALPKALDNQTNVNVSNSYGGVPLGYQLTHIYFLAKEDDETAAAIIDFLNTNGVGYENISYNYEEGKYYVELTGFSRTTEENVKFQSENLQMKFQNYCLEKSSSFGISQAGTVYQTYKLQY